MARNKYYYNPETCNFEPEKLDFKTVVRKGLVYFSFACMVSVGVFFYMKIYHKDQATKELEEANSVLSLKIEQFGDEIQQLEQDLEGLHEQDKEVYRSILKADPLEDAWAEGGTGGSKETLTLDDKNLEETRKRLERIHTRVKVQQSSYQALMEKMKGKEDELMHMPSIRPIATDLISGFGYRLHPILHVKKMHTGLDFRAPVGTPIYATADGTVKHSGRKGNGYGIFINMDHGYGYETKYAHLSKSLVTEGQKVKRGDLIAYSGNTGLSKGPHLHYEIAKDGKKIDPVDFFYSDLSPEKFVAFKKQSQQYNQSMD